MNEEPSRTAANEARKLAAIMFTDMVGFSRQMGADEPRMLRLLEAHNQIIHQTVTGHHGHVIKTMGDAFLVDFPSVVNAVQCAQQIQTQLRAYNTKQENAEQIHIRIGIHLGDVVQKDGDVFGDGVNIASRLQTLAEPDTVCISQTVYKEVEKKLPLGTVVSLGQPKLKNIAERFQVYALLPEPPRGVRQKLQVQKLKLVRRRRVIQWSAALLGMMIVGWGVFKNWPLLTMLWYPSLGAPPGYRPPLVLDKPSIAVLPFVNLSDDPKLDNLGVGITTDLIVDLSKLSGLVVTMYHSTLLYKGQTVKIQEVSQELGVRYIVQGSVRTGGDRTLITAQLIDGTSGVQVWGERYERPLRELFAVQEEVRHKILLHVGLKLTPQEEEHLQSTYTPNLEAYNYIARACEAFFRIPATPKSNAQARQLAEQAITLDPNYALAYSLQGFTYWAEWVAGNPDPQLLERAFTRAQQALSLDDSSPGAHELMGVVYLWRDKQHERALAEIKRSLAISPNWFSSYNMLAITLNMLGRPEETVALEEEALRLSPRSHLLFLSNLGNAYRMLRQYEKSIATYQRVLAAMPYHPGSRLGLASVYGELGREEAAKAEAAVAFQILPNLSLATVRRLLPYQDPAELERHLAALRKAGLKEKSDE
jgi:adenylate cyclase